MGNKGLTVILVFWWKCLNIAQINWKIRCFSGVVYLRMKVYAREFICDASLNYLMERKKSLSTAAKTFDDFTSENEKKPTRNISFRPSRSNYIKWFSVDCSKLKTGEQIIWVSLQGFEETQRYIGLFLIGFALSCSWNIDTWYTSFENFG